MRAIRPLVVAAVLQIANVAHAQTPVPAASATQHVMIRPDQVQWSGDHKSLASAVLEGNPQTPGVPYSILVRIPDGQWIDPHWHPQDKHVVVISGTLLMGQGDKVDAASATELPPGSYSIVPATKHHFEGAKGETVVLFYGMGPLITNPVKP